MIYLITGVPGSGKTLYAVSTLIKKLMSEKVKLKDGTEKDRRLLVDGIPDLLIPHEVITPADEDDKGNLICSVGDSVLTWPQWCRPGDIICLDEVQRYWRPRGMGTKPPDMIKALEMHRHLGVDFVLITQNPMLIDQNVRRLVGRHQHVRRLFGMARAIIYDWDGCSVDVHRTKTATSSMWSYPSSAYKLYKSSALHLKQRQKIPLWLAVPVIALVAGLVVMPKAFGTLSGAMSGKGVGSTAAAAPGRPVPSLLPVLDVAGPMASASAPSGVALAPSGPASAPVVAEAGPSGCMASKTVCACYSKSGQVVQITESDCRKSIVGLSSGLKPVDVSILSNTSQEPAAVDLVRAEADGSMLVDIAKYRLRPSS